MDSTTIIIITLLICVTVIISSSPVITIRRQIKSEAYQNNGLFLRVDLDSVNSENWENVYPPTGDWSSIQNSTTSSSYVELHRAIDTKYKFQLSCEAKCPLQWKFHPDMLNFTEDFVYSMQVTTSRTVGDVFNTTSFVYTSNLSIWELSEQSVGEYECFCIENQTEPSGIEAEEKSKWYGWAIRNSSICCHKDEGPRTKDFFFENEPTFLLMYPIIQKVNITYRNNSVDRKANNGDFCNYSPVTDDRQSFFRLMICSTKNESKHYQFYETLQDKFRVPEVSSQPRPEYFVVQIWPDVPTHHIEGDRADFNCTSIMSRAARNTHWVIEWKDGNKTPVSGETLAQTNMTIYGKYGNNELTPQIFVSHFSEPMRSGMLSISCYVPDWKSNGWVTSTAQNFTLCEFEPPTPTTVNLIIGEVNQVLSCNCNGTGVLAFKIFWRKNGVTLSGMEENLKLGPHGSHLWFTEVTSETEGRYTCYEANTNKTVRLTYDVTASLSAEEKLRRTLVILCLAVFLLLAMIIIYYIVRMIQERKTFSGNVKQINRYGVEVSLGEDGKLVSLVPCDYRGIIVETWRVIFGTKQLGIGNFGKVMRGDFKPMETKTFRFGRLCRPRPREYRLTHPIAIKTPLTFEDIKIENDRKDDTNRLTPEKLKEYAKDRMEYSFKSILSELKISTSLKKFGTHPNIVEFYGACIRDIKKMEVYILMELCDEGDLKSYLLSHSVELPETPFQPKIRKSQLSVQQLNEWCLGITSGLLFMEKNKLIHNDLSARNILLDSELVPKISDLGLARIVQSLNEIYKKKHMEPLPTAWLSIEALEGHFSSKSDIWSFGVVMWEIYSSGVKPPTLQLESPHDRLPLFPVRDLVNEEIWDTMRSCWEKEPTKRPDASTLNVFFKDIVQDGRRGGLLCNDSQNTQTAPIPMAGTSDVNVPLPECQNPTPVVIGNGMSGVGLTHGSSEPNYWELRSVLSRQRPEQIEQTDPNERYQYAETKDDDDTDSLSDRSESDTPVQEDKDPRLMTANVSIDAKPNPEISESNYVDPTNLKSWRPDKFVQGDRNRHYTSAVPEEYPLIETTV